MPCILSVKASRSQDKPAVPGRVALVGSVNNWATLSTFSIFWSKLAFKLSESTNVYELHKFTHILFLRLT